MYHPQYDEAQWKGLQDWALPMCDVIRRSSALGLDMSPSPWDTLKESRASYHIKGLCYAQSRRVGGPLPLPRRGWLGPAWMAQQGHPRCKGWWRWGIMMPHLPVGRRGCGTGQQRMRGIIVPRSYVETWPPCTSVETALEEAAEPG